MLLTRRLIIVVSLSTVRTKNFLPFFPIELVRISISSATLVVILLCIMCDVMRCASEILSSSPHSHRPCSESFSFSFSIDDGGTRRDDDVDDGNSIEGRGVWERSLYSCRVWSDEKGEQRVWVYVCCIQAKIIVFMGRVHMAIIFQLCEQTFGASSSCTLLFHHRFPSSSVLIDR